MRLETASEGTPCWCFVGKSAIYESIIETIQTIAPRKSPVVLTGETGTGKEIAARQIHLHSDRSDKIFIPVDCTALSGHIFESQLVGHVKGAFTGAVGDSLGFFRAADKGTIFLDEIGEIELDLQAKLLRVLQECAVVPVGATHGIAIDVRVVCATNRDLKQMMRDGKFRADLYFRLNVIKIEIPPLRERKEDILVLAGHFLERQARVYGEQTKQLSPATKDILLNYSWPGNVRELANAMEYAHIYSIAEHIEPSGLPVDVLLNDIVLPGQQEDDFLSFDEIQRRMIVKALHKSNGRKLAASRLLKIDHRRLARLVEEYDLKQTWR